MDAKVMASLSKAVKPGLINLKVHCEEMQLIGASASVFQGEPFLMVAIIKKRVKGKVEIEAI